jgi:hypothetical protein
MKHPSLLYFAVVVSLTATPALAQSDACIGCKEPAPMTDRERIKAARDKLDLEMKRDAVTNRERITAARDKFDLEMKRDTKRPWDGLDPNRKTPSAPLAPSQVPGSPPT